MWGQPGGDRLGPVPARLIHIQNVYRGRGPEISLSDREWHDAAVPELSEWSLGPRSISRRGHLPFLPSVVPLEIQRVENLVEVVIGDEVLSGVVSTALSPSESMTMAA
jgi:hypothetical protein